MKEERTDLQAKDLSPGKFFKITIECGFEGYTIHVNERFFAEYPFRCEPNIVDTVNIFGDIVLKKLRVEEKKFN